MSPSLNSLPERKQVALAGVPAAVGLEITLPCDEHGRPESINLHVDWR